MSAELKEIGLDVGYRRVGHLARGDLFAAETGGPLEGSVHCSRPCFCSSLFFAMESPQLLVKGH